jgi:D-glycero-D-manno-heptose 1,7-bisphosphate phosphatase
MNHPGDTMHWHAGGKKLHRYVLLDRDGVINRRVSGGYVTSWEQFEFLPRALEALRLLYENGYNTLVISNQACVGKGLLSLSELEAITRRFLLEVALSGGHIANVYYCRHRAEDRCHCRKPLPGLILRARAEYHFRLDNTYFIGDSAAGIAAADAADCPSILIERTSFLGSPASSEDSSIAASDLFEAAELLIAMQSIRGMEHALVRKTEDA